MSGNPDQLSLFARYPEVPGWKGQDTSVMAAEAIAERAPVVRDKLLAAIAASPRGLTPDEAADCVGVGILTARPRISELVAMKEIERTGERRPNKTSGKKAAVWRIKPKEQDR